jgi:hypothetical protein
MLHQDQSYKFRPLMDRNSNSQSLLVLSRALSSLTNSKIEMRGRRGRQREQHREGERVTDERDRERGPEERIRCQED